MRPQVVIAVLLAAAGIFGTILLAAKANRHPIAPLSSDGLMAATETNLPPAAPAPASVPLPASSSPAALVDLPTPPETNHEVYVQERVASLMALAMNDDATSLNVIWSELSNPDHAIREGALAAVVQFGDRSVAPRLRDLAGQIDDPSEKTDFLAAADRLEMPVLGAAPQPLDKR